MSYESLDIRLIIAATLNVLGAALLAYIIIRHPRPRSAVAQLAISISIFIMISALYIVEDRIHGWLGIEQPDSFSGHVIDVFWWLALAYLLMRILDTVLWRGILTEDGKLLVPKILVYMSNFFIILIVGLAFFRFALGKDVTVLVTTSGVFVIAMGYLAKAPFEQAFAGLALNLAPMFKKGDFVDIGGSKGVVQDIGWQQVLIRTEEGSSLYIPNTQVATKIVTNFDQPSSNRRFELEVILEYRVPVNKGRKIIESALSDLDEMITKYEVFVKSFAAAGVAYNIQYWRNDKFTTAQVTHAINSEIYYKIQKDASLDLGLDKKTIHEASTKGVTLAQEKRAALLRKVEIFESLDEKEVDELAETCLPRVFGPPEKIIRQGDPGDSMFVVAEGHVQIYLKTTSRDTIEVAIDGPGQYFGEMALLTGQPRGATARALDDVVLLEIPKVGLAKLLEKQPDLAGKIAMSVAEKQAANEALLAAADEKALSVSARSKKIADAIRAKVLNFFGLKEGAKR